MSLPPTLRIPKCQGSALPSARCYRPWASACHFQCPSSGSTCPRSSLLPPPLWAAAHLRSAWRNLKNHTRNEWGRYETTLKTSEKNMKLHSKRVGNFDLLSFSSSFQSTHCYFSSVVQKGSVLNHFPSLLDLISGAFAAPLHSSYSWWASSSSTLQQQ